MNGYSASSSRALRMLAILTALTLALAAMVTAAWQSTASAATSAAVAVSHTGQVSDANIAYVGRWDVGSSVATASSTGSWSVAGAPRVFHPNHHPILGSLNSRPRSLLFVVLRVAGLS